ncbi:MAG: ABC transporter permease [Desulfobacteraceae bacterium]|nr:ABC transporter permease [Desulfobacteraceae bacterium]
MRAYIIRRLLLIVPTLLMVSVIVFFLVRLIPGDVVDQIAMVQSTAGQVSREEIAQRLGLDKPVHVQYVEWIAGIFLRGDFGKSLWSHRPVLPEIISRFPVTVELGLIALLTSLFIALPIGIYSAIRQNTVGDYLARSVAIASIALPSFWIGTMIMVFPSIWWGWTPPMKYVPFFKDPSANLKMFFIPGVVLGMVLSGTTMRMTRTMMLEVLRQDYIRTAWSKGLKERVIVLRHALKSALIPVVTIVGLRLPILIGGSIILERIFVLPGIGWLLVDVINSRDYTVLQGLNLFIAMFVLVINLVVDLTYSYLDPRIHYT